jgi:hypothetical protein
VPEFALRHPFARFLVVGCANFVVARSITAFFRARKIVSNSPWVIGPVIS